MASGFGEPDALPINAHARVLGATLSAGSSVSHDVSSGRHAYLVPATGRIEINGAIVDARDGVALDAGSYRITATHDSELVLVDAD